MGKTGGFSLGQMKKLQKDLNKLQGSDLDGFLQACAKELAARLLAKVIRRTPVGVYPSSSGKTGGTLRRGWTSNSRGESQSGGSSTAAYADTLTVNHVGDMYVLEIVNPVEYASYVEYGHRTSNHSGWVQGRFMLTISEQEIQRIAPRMLERKLESFLKECLK